MSEKWHTVSKGEEPRAQVASMNNISTVALYELNPAIFDCKGIPLGTKLCLPLSCDKIISYAAKETCVGLEAENGLVGGDIRRFNPWVYHDCSNLAGATDFFGYLVCAAPKNGEYDLPPPPGGGDTTTPHPDPSYTLHPTDPPQNSTVAEGTTLKCGR